MFMKIAKVIAGSAAGLGFLLILGSFGHLDYASECWIALSPDEIWADYAKAGAGLLIFMFSIVFIALAEQYEKWKIRMDEWKKSIEEYDRMHRKEGNSR